MAKDLNKVQFTGHLGADPEMRYTAQGSAVTNFRVASNRTWKDRDGGAHEDTEWFRVVAWDKLGEICNQYLTKGSRVYIEGRLQTRKWVDRDNQDRYVTEVIAQDMIMLSTRGERSMPTGDEHFGEAEQFEEAPPPPAEASPRRTPAAATANGSRSAPSRSIARNQPQPIENDEDIPF
ncbi:MAG: single-stranded DNA-binding protein [Chloroflexia bacterium]|nr:single-stranded DNA-binding protein [Chloroflexia bacterium]